MNTCPSGIKQSTECNEKIFYCLKCLCKSEMFTENNVTLTFNETSGTRVPSTSQHLPDKTLDVCMARRSRLTETQVSL